MLDPNRPLKVSIETLGLKNYGKIFWTPSTPELYEEIVRRKEGMIAHLGPVVVRTGHYTGRSPKDKFIVREPSSESKIWWSSENQPLDEDRFNTLFYRLQAYLQGKDLFIQDCYAGAHTRYRIPIRVITETAWHNLFARNMFVQIKDDSIYDHIPEFNIIHVPRFHAVPELDGTNSEAFIIINFAKKLVLVGGTSYAGEIKKSVFTVLNYLFPQDKVLSMHCSANMGEKGDVALFFGLSGTGKTTLSSDPERYLIGDDEHGWCEDGIFNFEGGCYAKVIRLSKEDEPDIYECTRKFGTILENVGVDYLTRRLDLNDASLTENTRAAYPISHLPRGLRSGIGGHPSNIIMLTCDAFGVMPPVAKLETEQAMYHFLSGYTAKVAGTERGMGNEPVATFSSCFGAPFMALQPTVYAELLREKIEQYNVDCWIVNTGWIKGPFGKGERISISATRAIIKAILNGELAKVETKKDPSFGFNVPVACPGIDSSLLNPRGMWDDPNAYDDQARKLIDLFNENFKTFEDKVSKEVLNAAPRYPKD